MIPADCCEHTAVSRVKLEQRSSKVIFINNDGADFIKIKVDGCVVSEQVAADFVVVKSDIGDIVLELKGKNVEHAVVQIAATLRLWKSNNWNCSRNFAGLIVSRQVPKASLLRKSQEAFVREFKCPLHVVSHNQEFIFENILSFKGPQRA